MTVPSSRWLENELPLSAFYLSTSFVRSLTHLSIHLDKIGKVRQLTLFGMCHEMRTDRLALNKPGHGSKNEISGPLVSSDSA